MTGPKREFVKGDFVRHRELPWRGTVIGRVEERGIVRFRVLLASTEIRMLFDPQDLEPWEQSAKVT